MKLVEQTNLVFTYLLRVETKCTLSLYLPRKHRK